MQNTLRVIAMLLWAATASAQWPGVPAPSFGITETPGPVSVYVDEAKGDDSYQGSPTRPKRTIPRVLEAGTVVQVIGTQTTYYSSPNTIECHGTAAQPVFILGGVVGGELSGSYCILDGVSGPGWSLVDRRDGRGSDHLVVRHAKNAGTYGIYNSFGSAPNTDLVIWDVTGCGTYDGTQTEAQGDQHGVGIGKRSQRVWVLDSTFSKCSGDGVQVNGGAGGQDDTGPAYIGNLIADGNRQNGVGVKQSHDVVISGGHFTNMRPDADYTNPGAGIVAQYWPRRLAIIGTEIDHSENGIIVAGYDPEALASYTASGIGIFGAKIHDIHASRGGFDPANLRSPGRAIVLYGASARWVQDTVIDTADAGISLAWDPPPDPLTHQAGTTLKNNTETHIGSTGTPTPQPLPTCPRTLAGLLSYLLGRCSR